MEDKSNIEKATGNLAATIAGTAIGVFGITATPLAAFFPPLLHSLASGRHTRRLEDAIKNIEATLTIHQSSINDLSDDQYKLINESIASALYTINQEKLDYLVSAINNVITNPNTCDGASDHLSRIIRDISIEEIKFVLNHTSYVGMAVTDDVVNNDNLLKISPSSKEELLLTGLMHLGLVYAKDSTWDFQVYKWSPIVARLLLLLEL